MDYKKVEKVNQVIWLIIGVFLLGLIAWAGLYALNNYYAEPSKDIRECSSRRDAFENGFYAARGFTNDEDAGWIDSKANNPDDNTKNELEQSISDYLDMYGCNN